MNIRPAIESHTQRTHDTMASSLTPDTLARTIRLAFIIGDDVSFNIIAEAIKSGRIAVCVTGNTLRFILDEA